VLVIHDDDPFRKALIAALDQQNFSVTFTADDTEAVDHVRSGRFTVVLLGLNMKSGRGAGALEVIGEERSRVKCGVIILGDPDPEIRTWAARADETLLKPVDPDYVATRARTYCDCA
jgi:DNA-binding response OmpR family regulator